MEAIGAEMGIPGCLAHSHTVQGLDSLTQSKSVSGASGGVTRAGWLVRLINQILYFHRRRAVIAAVPVRVWVGRKWRVSEDTAGRRVLCPALPTTPPSSLPPVLAVQPNTDPGPLSSQYHWQTDTCVLIVTALHLMPIWYSGALNT